jgi:hypothetical protein
MQLTGQHPNSEMPKTRHLEVCPAAHRAATDGKKVFLERKRQIVGKSGRRVILPGPAAHRSLS